MPPSKTTFVTGCQQMLALGVVLAALAPAASVVSLDVVRETPGEAPSTALQGDLAAYTRVSHQATKVPTAPVDPIVNEYSLTAPQTSARAKVGALPKSVTSAPEDVTGFGAVGVTWAHGSKDIEESEIAFDVRTRTGDTWSDWTELEYHDEHGPDPDSAEARRARPGTDPLLVGKVDQVQVRVAGAEALPSDMRLAVIDPGKETQTAQERPALDTTAMDGTPGDATALPAAEVTETGAEDGAEDGTEDGELDLQAATYTPKPQIFSRAQWGADESMREKSSLNYYEVHAGFVHHTVNANNYTRREVPALLRSIYAYHTQSRGWSDIGYNFLVDRFGRIWEGRYGGVDRPVVGAHTLNYNDYSFAMSAIGNFELTQPSRAMIQAYGALFAWKLSLHGVNASSTKQWVGSKDFQAINGHRDAASTACPGKYLYAKIPDIRKLAAEAQRGWDGRELESNLAGTPHPDLVVRRASDGKGFIIPTGGLTSFAPGVAALSNVEDGATLVASPDLTGDGVGDLLVRGGAGSAVVRPGSDTGAFGEGIKETRAFNGRDLITAVGDLNGDSRNDLVARHVATGRLDVYLGRGDGTFRLKKLGTTWSAYTLLVGAGDADGDGKADLLARDKAGAMWLFPGAGNGGFGDPLTVPGSWGQYSAITGVGDFDQDGRSDLFVRHAQTKYGYVLPSDGDGGYRHPLGPVTRLASAGSLLGAAEMTGAGAPDLVTRTGARLAVLPNNGTYETGTPIATGADFRRANLVLNAGDWDRDGFGDVITRNKKNGALSLWRGNGTGKLAEPVKIADGFAKVGLLAAVGDMTGDGFPDLMGQPAGSSMRIYPGRGLSGLGTSYVAYSRIEAARQIAVGRWDSDGAPDSLFRQGSKLALYRGNGPGGLTRPKALGANLAKYDWVIGVSDATLTGHADVIVREKASGDLYLLQGTATGLKPRRFLADGMGVYDLAG